jgi:hypothetical protein
LNFQRQPKKAPQTSSFREEEVAKSCCLCLLDGKISEYCNNERIHDPAADLTSQGLRP